MDFLPHFELVLSHFIHNIILNRITLYLIFSLLPVIFLAFDYDVIFFIVTQCCVIGAPHHLIYLSSNCSYKSIVKIHFAVLLIDLIVATRNLKNLARSINFVCYLLTLPDFYK